MQGQVAMDFLVACVPIAGVVFCVGALLRKHPRMRRTERLLLGVAAGVLLMVPALFIDQVVEPFFWDRWP